jgi:Leucine-rich repeat (LRR) protein
MTGAGLNLLVGKSWAAGPYFQVFYGNEEVADNKVMEKIKSLPTLRHVKFMYIDNLSTDKISLLTTLPDLEVLDFSFTSIAGEDPLVKAKEMAKLRELNFVVARFDERTLKNLAHNELRKINFTECPGVTNIAAWYASFIPTLEHINFSNTKIEDKGVSYLNKLKHLRFLYLFHTPIADQSCDSLITMPTLELLDVRETKISDLGIKKLATLPKLKTFLAGMSPLVSDKGIASLKGHKTLEHIELSNCAITDASLETFATIPNLQYLTIYKDNITDQALTKFKKDHPRIAVFGPQVKN